MPPELPRKISGRGSLKFKVNDVDGRFKIIKEDHLKEILSFVRERNRSMAGICSVRSIQEHIYHKFDKLFKYHTIRYALAVRLGLKYRSAIRKRLVFTPQRILLADEFCHKLVRALGEQAADTAVLVYMDETYCHQNHMCTNA